MKKDETGKQVYLTVQSILCILVAAALIAAAWQIYSGGMAQRTADPLAWIYTRDAVAGKLAVIAPLIFLCLGMGIGGMILGVKDSRARIAAKNLQTAGSKAEKDVHNTEKNSHKAEKKTASAGISSVKKTSLLQAVIVIAAIFLIIAGVVNGSARDVLYKAANICTECVGLG